MCSDVWILFGEMFVVSCISEKSVCIQRTPSYQYVSSCDKSWICMVDIYMQCINPLNAELNSIRHLLASVGARHIVHVSRVGLSEPRLSL